MSASETPQGWQSAGFEMVIGLEVHVQLSTDSKIFCGCPTRPKTGSVGDADSNAFTCPVCTAQPGALPKLNGRVVEYAVRAGLATGCSIRLDSVFARKNYFYPDLPKGYQISQFDRPICENGHLEIEIESGVKKRVSIQRIHMEEDAGKTVHGPTHSTVNLNRAGVPLLEVVSLPEMQSPEEAGAYLRALYGIVTYLGICDGNLQEGNFRCDANVSVRPIGSDTLGTRTETKNVNSFRFVEKAIESEALRQIELIQSGGKVILETRLYDPDRNQTVSMRTKEEADDYRYFQDPDLLPLHLTDAYVEKIRRALPELPEQKRARYVADFGLSAYDAGVLVSSQKIAAFFDAAVSLLPDARMGSKPVANLLTGEVMRRLNDEGLSITETQITPQHLADTVALLLNDIVSSTGAKEALRLAMRTGQSIAEIVDAEGLRQVSDLSAFEPVVAEVLAASPAQVAEFLAGKEKILGYFVGQVMKRGVAKANPALLQELIRRKIASKKTENS